MAALLLTDMDLRRDPALVSRLRWTQRKRLYRMPNLRASRVRPWHEFPGEWFLRVWWNLLQWGYDQGAIVIPAREEGMHHRWWEWIRFIGAVDR